MSRDFPEHGRFFHYVCLWADTLGLEGWDWAMKGLLGVRGGGLRFEFGHGFPCLKAIFPWQCLWVTPLVLDD